MKGSTSSPWDQDDINDVMEPPSFFKRFFGFIVLLMMAVLMGVGYAVYLLFVHFGVIA